jgi:hypothetical protein
MNIEQSSNDIHKLGLAVDPDYLPANFKTTAEGQVQIVKACEE